MIFIRPKDLVNRNEFVREPVDTVCRKLDKIEKNTILKGDGRGKSIVLAHMQNKKAGTETPFINAWFDVASLSSASSNLDENFFRHYREMQFSFELLSYLKQYYETVYNTHLINTWEYLDVLDSETVNFLNNYLYDDTLQLKKLLSTGEVSGEILDCMKKNCKLSNIELGIDNFDQIDNGNELTQRILKDYFSLFNKVILSVSDDTLNKHKDYKINEINYGSVQTIRLMFTKRIEIYNARQEVKYDELTIDWLTDDLILTLIEITNGNLKLILDTLWEVADSIKFYERYDDSIFNNALEEKLGRARRLKQYQHTPKFYI